jgi:hypothetical protein
MVPIAQVIPTAQGLTYTDQGLDDTKTYSYYVKATGSYGNDDIKVKIDEPLENLSQIILAQPSDSLPPCKPVLSSAVSEEPCESLGCQMNSFAIDISWEPATSECDDIAGYKIYRAASKDGPYDWLQYAGINGIIRDTKFKDRGSQGVGLSSLAYCYRISAIDRSGNESELSDPVCSETCPHYELPNVFTPNGDECNKLFSAYRPHSYYDIDPGEEFATACGKLYEGQKCPRFVLSVHLRVYNRWGKQVYEFESEGGDNNSIYIDWDGRATDGSDLATGVYYYVAEVTFDAIDPSLRFKEIKGWVHLLR